MMSLRSAVVLLLAQAALAAAAAQTPMWQAPLPSGIDSRIRFISDDAIAFTSFVFSEQGGEGQLQIFNAHDGHPGKTFSWTGIPRHSRLDGEANIAPLSASSFIVQIGPKLLAFSTDLVQLHARDLPYSEVSAPYNHSLRLYDSWRLVGVSGDTGLLVKRGTGGTAEKHWISTESLLDTAVESSDAHCCSGFNGTTVLFDADAPKLKPISIQPKAAPAHALCQTCFGISPTFATSKYIFAVSWPGVSFWVASPDGQLLYKRRVHDGHYGIEYATAAADAPRVALVYPEKLGQSGESYVVAVFDLATNTELQRLVIGTQAAVSEPAPAFQVTTSTSPHIALSPNGKRLAILVAGQLSMYELP